MYELRKIVNSVKRNFDPDLYFGKEGLIALASLAAGLTLSPLFYETLKTSQQTLPKLGFYSGVALTVAGAVFIVDDLLFNSKLLTYILEKA